MTTVALFALLLIPAKPVTLEVFEGGIKQMTIEWSETLNAKGKIVKLKYSFEKNSPGFLRSREMTYDPEGIRLRDETITNMTMVDAMKPGSGAKKVTAKFLVTMNKDFTIDQVITMGRKVNKSTLGMPDGAVVIDPSQYWFTKTQPEVGKENLLYLFEPLENGWHAYIKKYLGKKTVDVGGQSVEANAIEVLREGVPSIQYVDDQNMPLLIEDGKKRTVRKW